MDFRATSTLSTSFGDWPDRSYDAECHLFSNHDGHLEPNVARQFTDQDRFAHIVLYLIPERDRDRFAYIVLEPITQRESDGIRGDAAVQYSICVCSPYRFSVPSNRRSDHPRI